MGSQAEAKRAAPPRPVPPAIAVARFVRYYGPTAYHNPARYPTSDGVIPWRLFWLLYTAIGHVEAMERLSATRGIAHAIGLAMSGDTPGVREMTRRELSLAFLDD